MRVVMLTSSFPSQPDDYRGRFVWEMASHWASKGDQVSVIAPHPGRNAPLNETLEGVNVERVPIPGWDLELPTLFGGSGVSSELRRRPWLAASIGWQLWEMRRALASYRGRTDLLLSHWVFPMGAMGAQVASHWGIPHGVVEHGGGVRALQRFAPLRPMARRAVATSCAVQWVAGHQYAWASSQQMGKGGFVFPMPLPAEYQAPLPRRVHRNRPRLLWAGRMVSAKAGEELLHALAVVPALSLTMAGDGPMRSSWESLAQEVAPGRVTFTGVIPASQMRPLMDQHDAFVFTSRPQGQAQEGTPRTLLEAMARGLVPVAAATGGVVDWVEPKRSGLLYRPGDIQALAHCLTQIASRPEEAHSLSIAARKRVSRVHFDALRQAWMDRLPG